MGQPGEERDTISKIEEYLDNRVVAPENTSEKLGSNFDSDSSFDSDSNSINPKYENGNGKKVYKNVRFKPIDLSEYCRRLFRHDKDDNFLLISSAILDKEMYCRWAIE